MNRRAFLRHAPLAAGSLALSACAGSMLSPQYLISQQMILQQLLPHFPYNQNWSGIGQVSLTTPQLNFLPAQDKIRLGMNLQLGLSSALGQMPILQGLGGLVNKIQPGSCQLACGLRYDRDTRGIYLRDPQIESLQLSGVAANYTDQARQLINNLAPAILDQHPVHTLDRSLATVFLGNMRVTDNGIALGFGL